MNSFSNSELRDPQPPTPGARERAAVAARAHELGRRRRLVQGGGALALVAAVAVSVAALTAGGSSGPGRTNRVEAASSATGTTGTPPASRATPSTTTPAPMASSATVPASPSVESTPPAPAPTAPAPTEPAPTEPAPISPAPLEVSAPSTFTVSGTVTGNPIGTTVTITFAGPGGQFNTTADAAGNFSVGGLTAGDYEAVGEWVDGTNSATAAQRFGTVTIGADMTVSFSFTG